MASQKYNFRLQEPWNSRMQALLPMAGLTMSDFFNDAVAAHVLELEEAVAEASSLREQFRARAAEEASTLPGAPGPGPRPGSGAQDQPPALSLEERRRWNLERRKGDR